MVKHLDIKVQGKVQGVGFRQSTKAVADQLGVRGAVWNEGDGSVGIQAEAEETYLELFLDWCQEGPQDSDVTSVQSHDGDLKNYRNFEVVKKGLF